MVHVKMHKNAQICMLKFKNFPGAMPPNPMLGGVTAPLPKPNPLSTPALRVSRASLGAGLNRLPNIC